MLRPLIESGQLSIYLEVTWTRDHAWPVGDQATSSIVTMIAFRSSWNSGLDRHEEPLDHYAPQHHLAGRISSNISVTVFDLIAEFGHHQQSTDPTEQIGIVDPTDVLSTEELLMPLWAYRTAAVYLFLISFLGVIMNVIVVIVILNDPQVSHA